jgi:hypothetical protein
MNLRLLPALLLLAAPVALRAAEQGELLSSNAWTTVDFPAAGTVEWKGDTLVIGMGEMLTGVVATNNVPVMNYEIQLEARRTMGSDFFCGLTFPIATNHCTIIMGGWGGGILGMSSIDGLDASENQTSKFMTFDDNRWYALRVRVTPGMISAWLDGKAFIDEFETEGHRLHMRHGDIEKCIPLGIATWQTRGEIRNIRLIRLPEPPVDKVP